MSDFNRFLRSIIRVVLCDAFGSDFGDLNQNNFSLEARIIFIVKLGMGTRQVLT